MEKIQKVWDARYSKTATVLQEKKNALVFSDWACSSVLPSFLPPRKFKAFFANKQAGKEWASSRHLCEILAKLEASMVSWSDTQTGTSFPCLGEHRSSASTPGLTGVGNLPDTPVFKLRADGRSPIPAVEGLFAVQLEFQFPILERLLHPLISLIQKTTIFRTIMRQFLSIYAKYTVPKCPYSRLRVKQRKGVLIIFKHTPMNDPINRELSIRPFHWYTYWLVCLKK